MSCVIEVYYASENDKTQTVPNPIVNCVKIVQSVCVSESCFSLSFLISCNFHCTHSGIDITVLAALCMKQNVTYCKRAELLILLLLLPPRNPAPSVSVLPTFVSTDCMVDENMQMVDMIALKYIHTAGTGTRENKEGWYNSTCDTIGIIMHAPMMTLY